MDKVFESKDYCCGCTACSSICPKQAITMMYDECGFSYPYINSEKCIDCGLCKRTCHFYKKNLYSRFESSFVVKHRCDKVVKDSRSGGFFTALSDDILNNNGTVYGAVLDDNLFVRHMRVVNNKQRDALRKSKYVQSDMIGIFDNVANDLQDNRIVLFTGTGCQCDGLRSYLKSKQVSSEQLIVCDIVCHSNASPGLFKKYIEYQSKRFNSKIRKYFFRDKEKYSWFEHVEKIVFENGKVFYTDEYTNLFYTDDIRPCCYNCKYTSLKRCGDFTMADCWGGDRIYPAIVNDKGASLVLVNNGKARNLLNKIASSLIIKEIPLEYVMQPRLQGPEVKSATYDKFWYDYENLEFAAFMKIYGKNSYSMKNCIFRKVNKIIKLPFHIIKKLLRIKMYD